MQAIVGAFKDTSEPKQIQMTGLHVASQKYMTIRADDSSIYLKQVRCPAKDALETSLQRDES